MLGYHLKKILHPEWVLYYRKHPFPPAKAPQVLHKSYNSCNSENDAETEKQDYLFPGCP